MRVYGNILTQLNCYTNVAAKATVRGSMIARVRPLFFKTFVSVCITSVLRADGVFSNADRHGAGSGRLLKRSVR